ncbi:LPS translocon maturation chaperone LptM [Sphaerotilus uruguayifluvii]|uniref:Small lipoprotein YifL n=1 Tax=Sphaerotilus uruguayifluvii TaxID=2735897 RepID=A0ABX2G3P5_9BURK|nr:hypothetical protein [Leptothrix sp. C29]NRT56923.1 putative small lipoprotein YifL [Leptothrix sp. C29]
MKSWQRVLKTSVALACTALLAVGCGQKGPLTLKDPEARPASAPAPSASTPMR